MAEPDPAARRFFAMQMARLGGALLVMVGIAIIADALNLPQAVGFLALAAGLFGFFVAPTLMARKWSTRRR